MFAFDKQLHFGAGMLIGLAVGVGTNPITGLVFATVAGIVKEVYDKYSGNGTPELLDAVATVLGGITGSLWLAHFW